VHQPVKRAAFVVIFFVAWLDAAIAECSGAPGFAPALSPIQFLRSYHAYLNSPARLAVDSEGHVYATDPKRGRVMVRQPDGKIVLDISGLGTPLGVAVDSDRRIYLGDAKSGAVNIYDRYGSIAGVLGQGAGEFMLPNDIALHPSSGDVFVSDSMAHSIKRYSRSGQLQLVIGGLGAGDGQLNFPTGIFVRNDELYVVDQRNSRVQVLSTNGAFLFCINSQIPHPGGFSCDGSPCGTARRFDQDVWVDGTGRIFVSDAFDGVIHVMGRDGIITGTIGAFGTGSGGLKNPLSMVIDQFNRMFIASAGNGRIDMFGISDFSDPERYVPGRLLVDPGTVDLDNDNELVAYLELPGYRVDTIVTSSVRGNGVAAPVSITVGDHDRNSIPDLRLVFDRSFIELLPRASMTAVTVTGEVGLLKFEETGQVRLVGGVPPDADRDGVPDAADACPGTAATDVIGPDGCGLQQLCPCTEPANDAKSKADATHTSCIARATDEWIRSGTLSRDARTELMVKSAHERCGGQL